jgi:AsmA protein
MARRRGRFLRLALGLIVIAGAAAVAAPLLPLPPLKGAAESRLSETLGRRVTVESVRVDLLRGPALLLKGVTAQDDPSLGDGVFLKAGEVRAGIDPIRYLRTRRLAIDSLTLKSAEITLVRNTDGTWNWTTLGAAGASQPGATSSLFSVALNSMTEAAFSIFSFLTPAGSSGAHGLKRISLENGSVRLIDRTKSDSAETMYRNITLNASLARQAPADAGPGTQASGDIAIHSASDDSGSEPFDAALPFQLLISDSTPLDVSGWVGPGPLETRNLTVGGFAMTGDLRAERGKPLTAKGQLSGTELFIRTMNLSERVSRAVNVSQIGDMSPGTRIAKLEAAFQIDQGTINTSILRVQQVDGLGDARAENGSFKVDSALTVNYAATVTLTPDATAQIKSAGPMLGLLATLLETNNQLSVPVRITGDLRQPEVQVDVSRIF